MSDAEPMLLSHVSIATNDFPRAIAFHAAALAARADYGAPDSGAFVRDRDGHRIEAMGWDAATAP